MPTDNDTIFDTKAPVPLPKDGPNDDGGLLPEDDGWAARQEAIRRRREAL